MTTKVKNPCRDEQCVHGRPKEPLTNSGCICDDVCPCGTKDCPEAEWHHWQSEDNTNVAPNTHAARVTHVWSVSYNCPVNGRRSTVLWHALTRGVNEWNAPVNEYTFKCQTCGKQHWISAPSGRV